MPTLYFMPWCHLHAAYGIGPVSLIPFVRETPPSGLDSQTANEIKDILSSYRDDQGEAVRVLFDRGV